MKNLFIVASLCFIAIFYQNCGDFESTNLNEFSTLNRPDAEEQVSAENQDSATPTFDNQTALTEFKITHDEILYIKSNEVKLSWTTSDFAQAYLEFGETPDLGSNNPPELSFKYKTHRQSIVGLKPNTTYYYFIHSENQTGSKASFNVKSFKTLEQTTESTDPTFPPTTANNAGLYGSATAVCGNGVRESTEQCDDGNKVAGDKCSSVCSLESKVNSNAYYVSIQGSDTNNGKSSETPFKTIAKGLAQLSAGDTLYIKAGNYGPQTIHIKKSGVAGSPITIEGYQAKPADSPRFENFGYDSKFDPQLMPILDGLNRKNEGTAISVRGDYVIVKNFQIRNFHGGAGLTGQHGVLDNIIVKENGDPGKAYSGAGFWLYNQFNTLRNSITIDAGAQSTTIFGSNNLAEYNKIYGSAMGDSNGTDYYFIVGGTSSLGLGSNDNIVRFNYMERIGSPSHGGHGFTVKKQGERNIFENNMAVNIEGGSYVARHSGATNNIYRNNYARKGNGLLATNGAKLNTFENNIIENSLYGIAFFTGVEDKKNIELSQPLSSDRNFFKNITLIKPRYSAIGFREYANSYDGMARGNIMDGLKIEMGSAPLIRLGHKTSGNIIKNSEIKDMKLFLQGEDGFNQNDLQLSFENTKCTNCSSPLP